MRAAVLQSPGAVSVDEIPEPEMPGGGALIEVEACAVCGTDIKMIPACHRDLTYPRILGHEVVGRVREIDGDGFAPGDLVQVWPGICCGRCNMCLRGHDEMCSSMKILGFNRDGGFAEVLALPPESLERGLNHLPEGADPAIYALTEPLACCVSGQEAARVCEGDVVLILGGGPIGLLHAMLARSAGCEKVIITEKLPQRISLAKAFADSIVDVRSEPLADAVAVETEGLGVDVILAATPEVDIDLSVIDLLAPRGRVCVFCGPRGGGIPSLRTVHYRELSIVGTYGCSSRHCRTAVQMIASGEIKPERIITMRAPLDRIGEALDHAGARAGLKAVIDNFR